eukprot:Colp12_sorted_trinity150504_noHs@16095
MSQTQIAVPSKPLQHKLAVLGSGAVGKSSITLQYLTHRYTEDYDPTIEDSYTKQTHIDRTPVMLHILDTAGQEELTVMREQYMREGHGFLLVFSITDLRSFEEVQKIYTDMVRVLGREDVPLVLVGNKCDLAANRVITKESATALAKRWGCPYIETSAAERINIDECFQSLVRAIWAEEKRKHELANKKLRKPTRAQKFMRRVNRVISFLNRSASVH